MTTPDASATTLRRITVEDVDRAADFVIALTVFFADNPVVLEGDGRSFCLPFIAQKSRESRGVYWASEAYRPNQEVDLHQQELEHAGRVLVALSRGDWLIPTRESPWEDWDGLEPAEAASVLACPDCQACRIAAGVLAAAKLKVHIRAVVAAAPPLLTGMWKRLTALLQSIRTVS